MFVVSLVLLGGFFGFFGLRVGIAFWVRFGVLVSIPGIAIENCSDESDAG